VERARGSAHDDRRAGFTNRLGQTFLREHARIGKSAWACRAVVCWVPARCRDADRVRRYPQDRARRGGKLKVIASIEEPEVIARIPAHLDKVAVDRQPELMPVAARAPPTQVRLL
jgi:hypothetical protein